MKHLLLALTLGITLLGSNILYAQEEASGSSISIDLSNNNDAQEIDEVKERIKDVIDAVAKKVKYKIDSEIEIDIDDVSAEDLRELEELKKKIDEADWSDIGTHAGMKFFEMVVAIIAIIFTLGLPIIILLLVLIFSGRKRKQKMELINNFIANDQPVPSELIKEFDTGSNDPLSSGLKWTFAGLGIAIFLLFAEGMDAAALGFIPLGIGLAKLIFWKMNENKQEPQQ